MGSAFDKIAKKTETATARKSNHPVADSKGIESQVDDYVANKAEIKRLESEMASLESDIIAHVKPQQDDLAYKGSFTKSLQVLGNDTQVLFSTADRFTVPQDDSAQTEIKKLVGKNYDTFFEVKRSIKIKDAALKDEKTLDKIAEACKKAGLNIVDIFDVGDKIVAKDDLDRNQYNLPPEKLAEFRTLVSQSKPALK